MTAAEPPTKRLRVAVLLSHPTQYYSPWFRWIAAHTDLQLHVFYLWEFGVRATRDPQFHATFKWDVDLLSGYEAEFLPNTSNDPGTHHFRGLQNPSLPSRLAAWGPHAILVFGYAYDSNLRAVFWARRHRIPLIFRGDSHFLGRAKPALGARLALRLLYGQFASITYVGQANRRYFEALGVKARRLFFAPHCVDASRFDPGDPTTLARAAELRRGLGLADDTRVVLFAGKLLPAKQPQELLEAFVSVRQPKTALVFVGDGELSSALKDRARQAGSASVHFLPFANQSEMPSRYRLAQIFALPSRGLYETWGLAVNESMHLRVPALVSDRVGCQEDLVTDGLTGWVFRADDHEALKRKLAEALTANLAPVQHAAAERVSHYTYREATAGLLDAVRFATALRPRRA